MKLWPARVHEVIYFWSGVLIISGVAVATGVIATICLVGVFERTAVDVAPLIMEWMAK